MLSLNERFLLGSYKKVFLAKSSGKNPIKVFFKLMLKKGLIDGILTCGEEEGRPVPSLFLKAEEVKISLLNRCFGVNTLLKRAVQKYRLSKLAVLAPSCMFDGLNKTQYFGIGCNWTKTAVALKVGLLCMGALTETAQIAEITHITGKRKRVKRVFFGSGALYYETDDGESVEVPPRVHHSYTLTACRYCLNMSAKGTDITFVPKENPEEGLFIVRSERGWYTLAQVQKLAPGELKLKAAPKEEVESIISCLREKTLLNINDILERIELGLPVPKWSDNKLRKFYRAWNSVEDTNLEEEVF
ncbi:Coenzyme F420 hydrogenase/dehydrogenase, beta subunit C-terminal domain [Thermovibrio sp.]